MKKLAAIIMSVLLACGGFMTLSACTGIKAGAVTIANDFVSLSFDAKTGTIISLIDKSKGVEFLASGSKAPPFRLEVAYKMREGYSSFTYKQDKSYTAGTRYILIWQVEGGVTVTGSIALAAGSDELIFYSDVKNTGESSVMTVEYPVIGNIDTISLGGQDDYLAHSYAAGYLIHNPMENFDMLDGGFRFMPYPEGFTGATMQFYTYYAEGGAGLYFATRDTGYHSKWYNFYKNNGKLEAGFMHGFDDVGAGKGITVDYPVVVKPLTNGGWETAADIYKEWAVGQEWCSRGLLYDAPADRKPTWLLEDVGLATFGINASKDRSLWIDQYHELIDTRMFHILGPDWCAKQDFMGHNPGGMDDWFPARFNDANLAAISRHGDYMAPFEFDYIFNTSGADFIRGRKSLLSIPPNPKSYDTYSFPFLCPAVSYTKQLHTERDTYMAQNYPIDSMYYDITAANIYKICVDENHGHPVGGAETLGKAFVDNYHETNASMFQAAGKYIPVGTEVINETLLGVVDYYQARSNGAPATEYEGLVLRPLVAMGEAEVIPLFTYVYHEYGGLRLDGWGKLTEEIGDLYYLTAAKTYLWGGIYELNHEYSSMESIGGVTNSAKEHYWNFDERSYSLSESRAAYLQQFASYRTGAANKYWAYGAMRPSLRLSVPNTELDYFSYNVPQTAATYGAVGSVYTPSVINSVWQFRNETAAYFFSNVTGEMQSFSVSVSATLSGESYAIVCVNADGSETVLGSVARGAGQNIQITLPAYRMCMIELR